MAHVARRKFGESKLPDAAARSDVQDAIIQRRDIDQLGRRIEVAKRAAYGAAIARLAMTDVVQGFQQDWKRLLDLGREFEIALARHRSDMKPAAVERDAGELANLVQIDDMVRHD